MNSINSAYLLVFHGSRNPQYSLNLSRLADLVREQFWHTTNSIPLVEVAALEFADVPLSKNIIRFAHKAIAYNYQKVVIIPVFLSAGVHVREDIPQEVAEATEKLGDSIAISITDYISQSPQLTALIEQKFASVAADCGRILLAHGSRLSQRNVSSEQLAKEVCAINAYWTVKPDLSSAVQLLANQNLSSIVIVPFFLFLGRITDAIALQVAELQTQFPQTKLLLQPPLGATTELARLIFAHEQSPLEARSN